MPKNAKGAKGGGKKVRRGKKTIQTTGAGAVAQDRHVLKSDGSQQKYAQAMKMLGDRRIQANVYNSETRTWEEKLIHVRGKFRKRVWINVGDFVLVSTRNFETDGAESGNDECDDDGRLPFGGDVIHKYEPHEIKKLVKMGEFTLDDDDSEEYHDRFEIISEDEGESAEDLLNDKPKRPEVVPQQREMKMLPSDSEDSMDVDKMTKAELQAALEDL